MKLTELLQGDRPRLSFEVFPPKTDTAFEVCAWRPRRLPHCIRRL